MRGNIVGNDNRGFNLIQYVPPPSTCHLIVAPHVEPSSHFGKLMKVLSADGKTCATGWQEISSLQTQAWVWSFNDQLKVREITFLQGAVGT